MECNLPSPRSRFIGRESELAEISNLLLHEPLISLTGPAGCGKTRLAIEICKSALDRFQDGAVWVELASLADSMLLVDHVSNALELQLTSNQDTLTKIVEALKEKQLLLILDCCDHLIDACAHFVDVLLQACPHLRLITTSQEPLQVAGEVVYAVHPLSLPDPEERDVDTLSRYEATMLFMDRAGKVRNDFSVEEEEVPTLIEICQLLDGNPLAIELASVLVKALTLREIQLRLDDRLDLLRGSERGQGDSRHLSLRAALGWSYGLLSPEEQKLLRRFSVFQGGGRLSSIAAICHDESLDSRAIQANLVSLVGKSLVEAETIGLAEARYQLTNSIRIFGFENLQEAGEENWVRERHFEHFLSNADACALQLQESSEQSAMEWMELESDNLRAALAWSLESGNIEVGLQLAIACSQFWTLRGISHEGLLWFERLLGRSDVKISTYTRLDALVRASALAMFSGDQKSVDQYARELTEIGEELNSADEPDLLLALGGLVFSAHGMGDYETAFRLQDKAIKLLENSDDAYSLGMALILQGGTAVAIGKLDVASGLLVQGEALAREAGDTFRYALALRFEGDLARCQEDYTLAQKQYERSETLLRALGPGRDLATVLCSLGYVHLHFNRPAKGFELFNEAMQMHQADSNHAGMVECLLGMGALAIQRGAFREGVHLLSAADALGGKRVANWAVNKLEKQKALQVAAQALDPLLLKEEQRYGFSLTMEEALRIVENLLAVGEENPSSKLLDALTGREREVVGALIRGMSNEEIAAEFMISVRTVEKHVSNVLSKLNLARRTQIVHWVNEQGLNEFLS